MTPNDRLLEAIKSRGQKQEPFAYGILTADRYARTFREYVGLDAYNRVAQCRDVSFDDVLTKAARTLTYTNPDMELEEVEWEKQAGVEFKRLAKDVELPKNTLMVFRHTVTTPRVDRDGDILRTQGAEADPKMLGLFQHVHTLPIGKMLKVAKHNSKRLSLVSCIVDINELCHDAAVMIDNKMGRFSHGFRATEVEEFKDDDGEITGFDVKQFEIMEWSLVSVPSNVDAETEEVLLSLVEGGKLVSPVMKEYGRTIRDRRPLTVPVKLDVKVTVNDQEISHENKSRGGGEASRDEGRETGSPEEADADEKEEKAAEDAEVKRPYGPDFSGSWEWVAETLRYKVKRHLLANGVSVGEDDWTFLVATYANYAIMAHERRATEDIEYYKVDWKMVGKEPEFDGEPKKVDVKISVEVLEHAKSLVPESEKPYPNFHACRLRSPGAFQEGSFRTTTRKHDGKTYSIISGRLTGQTTMTEQAYRYKKTVWEAGEARTHCGDHDGKFEAASEESVEGTAKSITVDEAGSVVLCCGTATQRTRIKEALEAMEKNDRDQKIAKQYRALLGAKR